MFLIMGVTLYTSRVILQALGVEDYGIYNVVGGIVSMMGIIKGVMAGATSRFLNFAIGKEDPELAQKTFSVSLIIYYVLSLIFVLIAETVGLWFLNTQLIIPEERITAANWVYQFTILSAINQLIASPYNAAIIAHEKMNIFAYISILEVVLKLLIVFCLYIGSADKLILYGLLMLAADLIVRELYRIYCRKNYKECKFKLYKDKRFFKEILSYSSWNLFGSLAALIKGQGLNILLNMFFNAAVNASRGLSYQINNAINLFISNFYTAVKPQITKYYAKNELNNMFNLICRSAKMAFFLFMILTLPIFIEAPFVINTWLGQLPENVVEFVRLILLITALDCIQQPLKTTAQATGKVAKYELVIGIITVMNIPISYSLLKFYSYPPVTVFYVSLALSSICFMSRLLLLKEMVGFPIIKYIKYVVIRGAVVCIIAMIFPLVLKHQIEESVLSSIYIILASLGSSGLSIYLFGLSETEKKYIVEILIKKIRK